MLRLLTLSLFVLVSSYCQTATLSVPDQTLNPSQSTIISLSLDTASQSIAAIHFDLQWDQAVGLHLTAGDQLLAAAKAPYSTSLGPHALRCLIVGMNQTALADGELLKMFLSVDPGAPPGTAQVAITNVGASDRYGGAVSMSAAPIRIQIQNGTAGSILNASSVVNAASLSPGPLSPGEIITIFGFYALPSVTLQIGVTAAPVLYADASQVNAIVPFGLDLASTATVQLMSPMQTLSVPLPVAPVTPGIFTANGSGLGPGAVLNEDLTINSFDNPARPGSIIMVYGTGFGVLQSPFSDGQVVADSNPTAASVFATVAGTPADVLSAGSAPGLVAGVTQVNIRLPAVIVHNPSAPLTLTVSGSKTPAGTTVAIQ
jgi:uncharacterized protein (TIGR03437 family)